MAGSSSTTNTLTGLAGMLLLVFEDRQPQTERSLLTIQALFLELQAAEMGMHNLARDVQAKSRTGRNASRGCPSIKALEDPFTVARRDETAPILHSDMSHSSLRLQLYFH